MLVGFLQIAVLDEGVHKKMIILAIHLVGLVVLVQTLHLLHGHPVRVDVVLD